PTLFRSLAPATSEARARRALSDLGIDGLWSRDLDTLSGGQRQLVALSRIIALAPDLLILDQPSQSLDPLVRRGLAVTLRAYCEIGRASCRERGASWSGAGGCD